MPVRRRGAVAPVIDPFAGAKALIRGRRLRLWLGISAAGLAISVWLAARDTRVRIVEPGKVVRGAWQSADALRSVLKSHRIKTVVTLTAINGDDPKYIAQEPVLREHGARWILLPWRGSTATLDQMSEAADLLHDRALQPVFVHCVGGHHRTGLAVAAYRIKHQGWTAEQAWDEMRSLPWTRPDAPRDRADRKLVEAFAQRHNARAQVAQANGSAVR